jgi:acetoin utilization protein AcuB
MHAAKDPDMLMPSVSRVMTPHPITVDRATSIAAARALMTTHKIRHLPVVGEGRLVGIVSERDLQLVESSKLDVDTARVDLAMTPNPFIVTGDTALDEITEIMAEHKYSSVIVVGRDGVEGIFTAVDACGALTTLLRRAVAELP